MNRKLRMGMIGGGRGAFIGAVHRAAAIMDGKVDLVAGCFSSDPEKSRLSGQDLFLNPQRVYRSYQEMIVGESALPATERIDFVAIVTPNSTHVPVASAFLKAGFNVVCDKPLALSLSEAKKLRSVVQKSGKVFALTHNYTGYPMVKQARYMVAKGELGRLLKVVVEYPQGWCIPFLNSEGKGGIALWRQNPAITGAANCMGDIGTHAHNLVRYITGLEVTELCADLSSFIPGHPLDDDGNCLVRYTGGAKGVLFASQIANGDENALSIRVYGSKAGLEWHQEQPNELIIKAHNQPRSILRRGNGYLCDQARKHSRIPFGHPEAFIEAFANIYVEAGEAIWDEINGQYPRKGGYDFPGVDDGVAGNAFIETAVKSAKSGAKWAKFPKV